MKAMLTGRVETWLAHLAWLGLFALLFGLAFPHSGGSGGAGWWLLGYVALIPFGLAATRSQRTLTLAWTTLAVALAWWLVMLRWLVEVTAGGTFGLALTMAVYWMLAALMLNAIHRRHPRIPLVLLLPGVWMTIELLRSTCPMGGFSWFCLAHVIMPWRPEQGVSTLAQIADIFAQYGVSFVIAMIAGAVLDELNTPGKGRGRSFRGAATTLVVLTLAACVWHGWRVRANTEASLRPGPVVGVVQTNVPQDNKTRPSFETDKAMWDQLASLTRQVASGTPKPQLIVWPETSTPAPLNAEAAGLAASIVDDWSTVTQAYFDDPRLPAESRARYQRMADLAGIELSQLPQYMVDWYTFKRGMYASVQRIAREAQTPLLVGSPTVVSVKPSERYNSVYYVSPPEADTPGRYDKMHRVPFGEYLPWVESVPALRDWFIHYMTPYDEDYSLWAGRGPVMFRVPFGRSEVEVVTPICFEDAFPQVCRELVYNPATGRRRASLMVNVTNDGWYPGTAEGPQHMQLATLRCIETRTPMVRCVNTGVSGLIDSQGRVAAILSVDGKVQEVAGTLVTPTQLDERESWYGRHGLWPAWTLAAVVGLLWLEAIAAGAAGAARMRRSRRMSQENARDDSDRSPDAGPAEGKADA